MAKVRPTGEASVCRRQYDFNDSINEDEIVTINISGERYQTLESTLKRFPDSVGLFKVASADINYY